MVRDSTQLVMRRQLPGGETFKMASAWRLFFLPVWDASLWLLNNYNVGVGTNKGEKPSIMWVVVVN